MKTIQTSRNKKIALISTLAVLTILLLSIGAYSVYNTDDINQTTKQAAGNPLNPINYDPPTEQEKKDADKNKDKLIEQEKQTNTPTSPNVSPVITNASQISQQVTINAYVPGIFEDDGTCTATFTRENVKITKTSKAFANASTTDCTPIRVERSEFSSSGDWKVTITYTSSSYSGTSQSKTLTLQ